MAEPLLHDYRWMVTTAFALYGAGLSTYQQIGRIRDRRPNVTVNVGMGIAPGNISGHFDVKIKNIGVIDVFLKENCCVFWLKEVGMGTGGTQQPKTPLPTTLKPG